MKRFLIAVMCAAGLAAFGAPTGECIPLSLQNVMTNSVTIGDGHKPPVMMTSFYIVDCGSNTWRTNTFTLSLKKVGMPASSTWVPIVTDSFTNGMYIFAPANTLSFGWGDQLRMIVSDTNYLAIINR